MKQDNNLPICGSVKARGGLYETFTFAEEINNDWNLGSDSGTSFLHRQENLLGDKDCSEILFCPLRSCSLGSLDSLDSLCSRSLRSVSSVSLSRIMDGFKIVKVVLLLNEKEK